MSSTANDEAKVPLGIIINSIACPFIVVLNVQVIMAVKTRPRLRTNSNILLTCLAVTDALTGLTVQPLFVLGRILRLFDVGDPERVAKAHNTILFVVVTSSLLHLMLVTFERLVAIKFTMHYSNVITGKNLKLTVGAFWSFSFICGAMWQLNFRLFFIFLCSSCFGFMYPFRYVSLRGFVSWNPSPPKDDKNSSTAPRRGWKIY